MTGRIAGDMMILLAVAFTVYLAAVMIRRINAVVLKRAYGKVFRCELIACAFFILLALDIRFDILAGPGAVGPALRALVILAVTVFLLLIGRITVGSLIRARPGARYAIVLGLALENGRPAADLIARLDAAEAYLRQVPGAKLILTGGNPDEGGRTEARVMRDILARRGVAEDRMLLEDRAKTTKENFKNAARMIDPARPVALITSDYHMDRAARTAKGAGFADVRRLPAPSAPAAFGANVMWEMVLELNDLSLKRQLSRRA